MLGGLYSSDYKTLISKVGSTGNEENIKETENYIFEIDSHRDGVLKVVKIIKGEITSGRVTFKGKNTSKFGAFKSRVQRRLGIKSLSSTGRVLGPEESYQQISGEGPSDENTSNQGPPDQGTSKQEPSDEDTSKPKPPGQGPSKQEESKQGPSDGDTSNQGPPGQQAPDQAGAKPIPPPRKSEFNRQDLVV
ncbi:hypothetical protein BSLG_007051 [Batrachochytrium salamandrivorans]|nr:hypothetical protein BASA60_008686 [Batrachochytrium salamandrivorans]KAJ1336732.1 hypothetical protein BSLG_007051 [Batrachochytrium salamandrivorans]